jgi:acyl-coenzyme A synthetase/AMP-(fatty) acid ligase
VGIKDVKYGEVVGCFLRQEEGTQRSTTETIRRWVRATLKSPRHVFWLSNPGIGSDFPKTASGKHEKHILRDIGNLIVGPDTA